MADGQLSLGLLKDIFDLFDRFQSTLMLTKKEKDEIIESVLNAVIKTEIVFGKSNSRKIIQDDKVAQAWCDAGKAIIKYLPDEHLGIWLQNKGEAWANPNKWPSEVLDENKIQIEQIKERVQIMTKTRRKYFRPKDI